MTLTKSSKPLSVGGNDTEFNPDPELYNAAGLIVTGSIIKRRNEQSVNWYMFALGFVVLIVMPVWWVKAVNDKSRIATISRQTRSTDLASININGIAPNSTPVTYAISDPVNVLPTITPPVIMTLTPQIIIPTFTPPPSISGCPRGGCQTATPPASTLPDLRVPDTNYFVFAYSYYYPELGGANCDPVYYINNHCMAVLANGERWEDNLYKAVAIHPALIQRFPLGTQLQVIQPVEIAGVYTVKDYCSGCLKSGFPNMAWLDFLDDTQRLEWSTPVIVEIKPPE